MLIPCSGLEASFADPGVRLELDSSDPMVIDEHGGTFVLKVGGLRVTEAPENFEESNCHLEISLTPKDEIVISLKEFAGYHQLSLAKPFAPNLEETALLAAFHLPGKNLFIFAEEPKLTAVPRGDTVELAVAGTFKARRVPCQETDLIIHLGKGAMTKLVAFLLNLACT